MFLPGTSRGNARYRPAISLARFGIRLVYRRTSGWSSAGLIRHTDSCATAGFRLPKLHELAALRIKATSRKPIRVCGVSAQALGGDSRKLLRSHKKGGWLATAPAHFDSNRQRMFALYKSVQATPLSFREVPWGVAHRNVAAQCLSSLGQGRRAVKECSSLIPLSTNQR
jgi:hypothetical protein